MLSYEAHSYRLVDELCVILGSGGHQGDDEVLKFTLQLIFEGIHEVLQADETEMLKTVKLYMETRLYS